jgi:ACT domain-containing protein
MRAIITVIGKDRRGIIAGVSTVLADNGINILDISQTIMQEYFTMMMLVELSEMMVSLAELIELLQHKGQELGVSIKVQHEDIFQSMHRI